VQVFSMRRRDQNCVQWFDRRTSKEDAYWTSQAYMAGQY